MSSWQREEVAASATVRADRTIEFPPGTPRPVSPVLVRAAEPRRNTMLAAIGDAPRGTAAQLRPQLIEALTGERHHTAVVEMRHARVWDQAWYGGRLALLAGLLSLAATLVVLPLTFQNWNNAFGTTAAVIVVALLVVAAMVKARHDLSKDLSP